MAQSAVLLRFQRIPQGHAVGIAGLDGALALATSAQRSRLRILATSAVALLQIRTNRKNALLRL
jgi:hypothetical protein